MRRFDSDNNSLQHLPHGPAGRNRKVSHCKAGHFGSLIRREYGLSSMKATTVTFGRPSDPMMLEGNDAVTAMPESLGLGTASSPAPAAPGATDPMRGARQAIRSQAAAREYVERQLVHAEATVQELRTKLHHARREKDAAVEAARLATVAKSAAERTLIMTEAALTAEKAARDRGDRALREAQATIRDLQTRLDDAARGFETAKAELAAEQQPRRKAQELSREAAPAPETAAPVSQDEAVMAKVRRPVGRPRKTVATANIATSNRPAGQSAAAVEIGVEKPAEHPGKARKQAANEAEPVQWWVEGWNRRRTG